MAVSTYTTEEILERVRIKGGWTNNFQLGATDDDIIDLMNEAMYTEIVPRLMKVKEEYLVITRRIPISANKSRYRIPERAAGQKLRDLYYLDQQGTRIRLPHISRENRHEHSDSPTTSPEAYFLEGTHIVLVPDLVGASGQLELAYFFRPGQLVRNELAREVTVLQTVGGLKRFSYIGAAPSGWTTGLMFDIHSYLSGAQPKAFSITAQEVNSAGSYIDFTLTDVDGSQFGTDAVESADWICLEGAAVVPGLPFELIPVLVQATVTRMAEQLGDETYQYNRAELDRMLQAAGYLYDTRVEGQPKKLVSKQGRALYGGGGWGGGSW